MFILFKKKPLKRGAVITLRLSCIKILHIRVQYNHPAPSALVSHYTQKGNNHEAYKNIFSCIYTYAQGHLRYAASWRELGAKYLVGPKKLG